MHFQVDKHALLRILEFANRPTRETSELRFKWIEMEVGQGAISATGSNRDLGIKARCESITCSEGGKVIVPGSLLLGIVKSCSESTITISSKSNTLTIQSGKTKFNLLTAEDITIFRHPDFISSGIVIDKRLFSSAIQRVIKSVSKNNDRPPLNGVLIVSEEGRLGLEFVATDSYRLSIAKIDDHPAVTRKSRNEDCPETHVILPSSSLVELLRLIDDATDDVWLQSNDQGLLVGSESVAMSFALLESVYPNYKILIPSDDSIITTLAIPTFEFINAIKRVSIVSSASLQTQLPIVLSYARDAQQLTISADDKEIGKAIDSVAITGEGENMRIGFNPKYLLEALETIQTELTILEVKNDHSPIIVRPKDIDSYTHLIMPVRINSD